MESLPSSIFLLGFDFFFFFLFFSFCSWCASRAKDRDYRGERRREFGAYKLWTLNRPGVMNEPSSTSGGLRVWKQQTIYAVAGRQAKPIREKKRKKKWMSDGLLLLYVSAVSHQHQIFQTTRDRRSGAPSPSIKCSTESGLEVWNPFLDFQIHLNINWSTVVKNWLSRFDVNGVMGSVCPCGLFALHNSLQVSYFSFSSLHLMKLAGKIPLFYMYFLPF